MPNAVCMLRTAKSWLETALRADLVVNAVPWGGRAGARWTSTNRPPFGDHPATIPGPRFFHIRLFSPAVEGVGDRSIAWRDFWKMVPIWPPSCVSVFERQYGFA